VFDGGRLSSDGGVMLLALAEHRATSPLRIKRDFGHVWEKSTFRSMINCGL
jgi:hypothetical protein